MSWIGIITAAVGAYASTQADQYADSQYVSQQRKRGGTKDACGWKCTGCKATNAPSDERCPWCRSYRLSPAQPEQLQYAQNVQMTFLGNQLELNEALMRSFEVKP